MEKPKELLKRSFVKPYGSRKLRRSLWFSPGSPGSSHLPNRPNSRASLGGLSTPAFSNMMKSGGRDEVEYGGSPKDAFAARTAKPSDMPVGQNSGPWLTIEHEQIDYEGGQLTRVKRAPGYQPYLAVREPFSLHPPRSSHASSPTPLTDSPVDTAPLDAFRAVGESVDLGSFSRCTRAMGRRRPGAAGNLKKVRSQRRRPAATC